MTREAIAQLGFELGFAQSVMPSDATFAKVASQLGMSPELVKQAYIQKKAAPWLPILAGISAAGAGVAGAAAYPKLKQWMDPTPETTMRRKQIWQQMQENMHMKNMMNMAQAANFPGQGISNPYQMGNY